jgi:putative RNA 2'-phosphotransferase
MNDKTIKTSKLLSLVLRHQPDAIGLTLDAQGWADIATLIACANRTGKRLDRELLQHVVDTNDKKRFTISEDGLRIRAAQGHSIKTVDIGYTPVTPPTTLYHGTATRFVASIRQQGLLPGSRQFVHLSEQQATAEKVGSRHGVPVVLQVAADTLHAQGQEFYQADNGVWLTAKVPPKFIRF